MSYLLGYHTTYSESEILFLRESNPRPFNPDPLPLPLDQSHYWRLLISVKSICNKHKLLLVYSKFPA